MKKLFGIVCGPRLGGKTTLAGTLPGKTLLLQAEVLESGSRSAQALAKKNGYDLHVQNFASQQELITKLEDGAKKDYDNIFVDGFSAINEMRWGQEDVQKLYRKNAFDAFGLHGDEVTKLVKVIKKYTDGPDAKNVFITCALKVESKDNITDVKLEAKGQMGVTALTKMGEAVVTVMMMPTENGERRVMITKTYDKWPGRIDGVLDDDNGQFYSPDLATVIALADGSFTNDSEK